MPDKEKRYSGQIQCRHCLHRSPMEIVSSYSVAIDRIEAHPGDYEDIYTFYEILKCPACFKIMLQEYDWCDYWEGSDISPTIVYPNNTSDEIPLGLPEKIKNAVAAAQKVKDIDANAYAVLIGRVLEMVCVDRNAKGDRLANQLKDLSEKGEIPEKLVMVAKNLKDFRNIGAHATLGELTRDQVPILTALCNAVLEYVYTAPHLANQAEELLHRLNRAKKRK